MAKLQAPRNTTTLARAALADHQRLKQVAADTSATARKEFQQSQSRVELAGDLRRNAESALAAIIKREADGITAGHELNLTAELAAAEADVAHAKRVVAAHEQEKYAAETVFSNASLAAGVLEKQTEPLIAAVLSDTVLDLLAKTVTASTAAAEHESSARSLIGFLAKRGWFQTVEPLSNKLYALARPAWSDRPSVDWRSFAVALAGDALAEAPGATPHG